jgi:cytochrome P450
MSNGQMTDHLVIAKGSGILSSAVMINRSPLLWGEDAGQYRPDRWLEGLPRAAEEISGYRHTMTFLDGPKAYVMIA